MSATSPFWVSAFLDFAPAHFDAGVAFWRAVTGYDVSPARGADGEFATLLPPQGDAHLRVQRLHDGEDRIHLDVHVTEPRAAADRAVELGAREVADDHGYVVMSSPGGLAFCFVSHSASARPVPSTWPGGHRSVLDQVCLDIPEASYDAERVFWAELTGWRQRPSPVRPEYSSLVRPADQPLRLLFQRLGEPGGAARAHLDWSTTDRGAETARHEERGAEVEGRHEWWTVLTDPVGRRYCITDRDPETGVLPVGAAQ
jgi:hypothetical protein